MNDSEGTKQIKEELAAVQEAVEKILQMLDAEEAPKPERKLNRFPCKRGCNRQIVMSYTAKNGKPIVLEEVEDEDDGVYIINDQNRAEYTGVYGNFVYHFNSEGNCKTLPERDGLI